MHSLDGLTLPGIPIPFSNGCVSMEPSPATGLLCIVHRNSLKVMAWQPGAVSTAPPMAPGSKADAAAAAIGNNMFTLVSEHFFGDVDAIEAAGRPPIQRSRSMSIIPLGLAAAAASAAAASAGEDSSGRSRPDTPHLLITRATWSGPLLCVSIVHRRDIPLYAEEDHVPNTDVYDSHAVPDAVDSGYQLSYAFLHAFTGQVFRTIGAGPAPALDAFGQLSLSVSPPPGDEVGTPSAIGHALLSSLGAAALPSSLAATSAPAYKNQSTGVMSVNLTSAWGPSVCCREPPVAGDDSTGATKTQATDLEQHNDNAVVDDDEDDHEDAGSGAGQLSNDVSSERRRSITDRVFGGSSGGDRSTAVAAQLDGTRGSVVVSCIRADSDSGGLLVASMAVGADGSIVNGASSSDASATLSSLVTSYYSSPCFPYSIAVTPSGLQVISTATGSVMQTIKIAGVHCLLTCPEELAVRRELMAGRGAFTRQDIDMMDEEGEPASPGVSDADGAARKARLVLLRRVLARPETVYACTSTGIIQLRMVPAAVQVAALLSKRPPQFSAALSLCDEYDGVMRRMLDSEYQAGVALDDEAGGVDGAGGDAQLDGESSQEAIPRPDLLAGVSETRIQSIRAQFGYSLFATGDFAAAIHHLEHAGEPIRRIAALFPQVTPPGCRLDGYRQALPVRVPAMLDGLLPTALPPLIGYLLRQRKMIEEIGADSLEAAEADQQVDTQRRDSGEGSVGTPVSPGGGGTVDSGDNDTGARQPVAAAAGPPVPLPVLVDMMLLISCLWLQRYHIKGASGTDAAPASTRLVHRLLRAVKQVLQGVLCGSNHLDVAATEVQLHAFGLGVSSEAVSLYQGKGLHGKALRLLAGQAEAAVRTAASLVYPIAGQWAEASQAGALGPVLRRVWDLCLYLRRLGVHAAATGDAESLQLFLKHVKPLLTGGCGVWGVAMAMSALTQCDDGVDGSSDRPILAGGSAAAVMTSSVLTLASSIVYRGDHPQLWTLSGGKASSCTAPGPTSLAELLSTFLVVPWSTLPDQAASQPHDNEDKAGSDASLDTAAAPQQQQQHRASLLADLGVLPAPSGGWGRLYTIAILEHLRAASPSSPTAFPAALANRLISCYLSVIEELSHQLDRLPTLRIAGDSGLMAEYRRRLQAVLTGDGSGTGTSAAAASPSSPYDAPSALASLLASPLSSSLLEERCLLLEHCGDHASALRILVHDFADFPAAEGYCARVHVRETASSSAAGADAGSTRAFSDLLSAYLHGHGVRGSTGDVAVVPAPAPAAPPSSASVGLASLRRHGSHTAASSSASPSTAPVSSPVQIQDTPADTSMLVVAGGQGVVSPGQDLVRSMMLAGISGPAAIPRGAAAALAVDGSSSSEASPVERVMGILSRNYARVDAVSALASLPSDTPMAAVAPFLTAAVQHAADTSRMMAATRSLSSVTSIVVSADLKAREARAVTLEKTSLCPVCGRRLAVAGKAAPIAVFPTGLVVHAACMDQQPQHGRERHQQPHRGKLQGGPGHHEEDHGDQ